MSVIDIRTAIAAGIKTKLPELRTCKGFHGRFDNQLVKQYFNAAPGVLVFSPAVASAKQQARQPICSWRWVAYAFASGPSAQKRHDMALLLGEALVGLIVNEKWGVNGASQASDVRGESIYDDELDKDGLAVWAIAWTQPFDIELTAAANISNFLRAYTTFETPPESPTIEGIVNLPAAEPASP